MQEYDNNEITEDFGSRRRNVERTKKDKRAIKLARQRERNRKRSWLDRKAA